MTAKLMLGAVLVGKGSCSQAITLYERILGEAPKQPSIYYNLGNCYFARNAPPTRSARPSFTTRPSRPTPRDICSPVTRSTIRRSTSARSPSASRRDQDQVNGTIKGKIGRIYLGMKNYQSAVT